jgi:hypothetical protein
MHVYAYAPAPGGGRAVETPAVLGGDGDAPRSQNRGAPGAGAHGAGRRCQGKSQAFFFVFTLC